MPSRVPHALDKVLAELVVKEVVGVSVMVAYDFLEGDGIEFLGLLAYIYFFAVFAFGIRNAQEVR